jgi:DNA-directed RNA polymerase specialized sigma54-like protein
MSELERQLESHRNQTFQTTSINYFVPSLFLTSKEAGLIDIDIVYEAAIEGIQFLNQYDQRFHSFLNNILHPSSKTLQRELQTGEVLFSHTLHFS